MKFNQWTLALAAAGVVSLGSLVQAEEAQHQVLTALSSTTLSGYVDTSAIWKFGTGGPGNATLPGRYNDGAAKQDGFNLNVAKLSLAKPLDESQWSAGYQLDLLFGPDANIIQTTSTGIGISDFAIQQAAVNLRAPVGNGLDLKMGVFESPIGYESFDAYKNPNFSRSYGFSLEPKAHTGVMASYQVVDWMSVAAGVANTVDNTINGRPWRAAAQASESEKTYLGAITVTAPESLGFLKGGTLYAGVVNGLPSLGNATDITLYYVGGTVPTPLTGLSVGACYDYRGDTQIGATPSTYANAAALYLSYQATEKLKVNNRFEYATGSVGTWGAPAGATENEEAFIGETVTLDYSLWANVVTRAEFRWDHDLTARRGAAAAFGNDDKNALSLALNVIYKF